MGNLSRQTDHVFEENRVMVRTLCIAVLTLTVALTNAAAFAQEKSSGRVPWWRNSTIQQGLLLTDGQILQLEQIFQQQLPARIALQRDLYCVRRCCALFLVDSRTTAHRLQF